MKMRLCCRSSRERNEESPIREQKNWISQCYDAVASIFSRYPFVVLFTTLIFSFMISWLGVSSYGLPEFEDPYLGFETRKTVLANRLTAMNNLRHEYERQGLVESYPGQYLTSREIRKRRGNIDVSNYCSRDPAEDYSRVALELAPDTDLFSLDVLKRICYFEKLMENIESYSYLCEKDGHGHCCPTWSLPSYIAIYANHSSCSGISKEDVQEFYDKAKICAPIYANETIRSKCYTADPICPEFCKYNIIQAAILYTIESSHFTKNSSKFSMVILPIPKHSRMAIFLEDVQSSIMDISLPDEIISLGGFDFGNKDELFKDLLVSDLKYMIMASVIIFLIVCCYTKSFFVTVVSFGALTLSLGVSYFLYNSIFKIPYFPFMNMLVTIIVLGIGTDGTLIFSVAWRRCRSNLKDEPFDKHLKRNVMLGTLEETTATLFITTCTTAGAFFASLASSVTTIRCFSIFAGTTIVVSFILLYLCVPTALLASDIIWIQLTSLYSEEEKGTCLTKSQLILKKIKTLQRNTKNLLCPLKFNKIIKILTSTKLSVVTFLLFTAILIWGLYEVFVHPGFELPNSEQFQLLSFHHPAERFDREIETRFNMMDSQVNPNNKITLYFIWGAEETDTGASFDPNDHGVLKFDKNFTLSSRQHQKWMQKFCKRLKKQPFYDPEANAGNGAQFDSCAILSFIKWMKEQHCDPYTGSLKLPSQKPCCKDSKFPYSQRVFSKCISRFARYINRTPIDLFRPDIAGPKFITIKRYKIETKSTKNSTLIKDQDINKTLTMTTTTTTTTTTAKTIVLNSDKNKNINNNNNNRRNQNKPTNDLKPFKFDEKLPIGQNINFANKNKGRGKFPLTADNDNVHNSKHVDDDDDDDEEIEEGDDEDFDEDEEEMVSNKKGIQKENDDTDDYDYDYDYPSDQQKKNAHLVKRSRGHRSLDKKQNNNNRNITVNNHVNSTNKKNNNHIVAENLIIGETDDDSNQALKQNKKHRKKNLSKGQEPDELINQEEEESGEDEFNAPDDLVGDLATFTLRVVTNTTASLSYEKNSRFFNSIEHFFERALKKAPAELQRGFVITSSLEFFDLQNSLLNDTWHSLLLSTGICFVFIWISSGSFYVSVGAVVSILAIVVVSSAILIEAFSWKLGVFESIAVTVAVGLSDFTAHHAIEFAKRQSIMEMTSPTFVSALTTIIMGLSMMLFSEVLVYQQIGSFFFVLILTSWLYSVFFLSPLLLLFHLIVTDWIPKCAYFIWSNLVLGIEYAISKLRKSNNTTTAVAIDGPSSSTSYSVVNRKNCECAIEDLCECEYNNKSKEEGEFEEEEEDDDDDEIVSPPPPPVEYLTVEKMKKYKKIAQETAV